MASDPPVPRGNLEYQQKQAKQLLKAFEASDADARARAVDVLGDRTDRRFVLTDAQFVLAAEHGFRNWAEFRQALEAGLLAARPVLRINTVAKEDAAEYQDRADRLRADLLQGDSAATRRVRAHLPRFAEMTEDAIAGTDLPEREARLVVAREYGYPTFHDLVEDLARVRQALIRPAEPEEATAVQLVRVGDATGLRALLDRQPELVNQMMRPCNETLLGMVALPQAFGARFGQELGLPSESIKVLIEAGSDLEGPLNLAAAHNRVELVRLLLEAGADRDALDDTYGITPLQAAIYNSAPEAADVLAEAGIAPNAFYVAAAAGRVDLLSQWLDDGRLHPEAFQERPNMGDVGWPPRLPPTDDPAEVVGEAFTLASYNGRIEAAQWLLDNGADINARPYLDTTALHFAVLAGRREMVEWLLAHGADRTLRDAQHGGTPVDWARYEIRRSAEGPAILESLEGG